MLVRNVGKTAHIRTAISLKYKQSSRYFLVVPASTKRQAEFEHIFSSERDDCGLEIIWPSYLWTLLQGSTANLSGKSVPVC